jgi:hypothetical protein
MSFDAIEEVITATERAEKLLTMAKETEAQKAALIAELTAQRQSIDEALVALGAKRRRKSAEPKAKRTGRPVGSKNKPRNAQVAQPLRDAVNAASEPAL